MHGCHCAENLSVLTQFAICTKNRAHHLNVICRATVKICADWRGYLFSGEVINIVYVIDRTMIDVASLWFDAAAFPALENLHSVESTQLNALASLGSHILG